MIGVAVCAHYARQEVATALGDQLSAPISWDDGSVGILENHDRALRIAEACAGEWAVVIEDDAQPIEDFREQASLALDACSAPFACLYFGYVGQPRRRIAMTLERTDPHWVMKPGFTNAVCIAVRKDMVTSLLYHADGLNHMTVDQRYSAAAFQAGVRWIPHSHPSLVEHSDIPGIDGACGIPRRAYSVGSRLAWSSRHIQFYERVWE